MKTKAILLLDHLEAVEGESPEMDDLRSAIADRGSLLTFGVFHAPNHIDHTIEANIGRANIKPLAMNTYGAEQTKALIRQFYEPLWAQESPGFTFDKDAYDALIALEPGAWIYGQRKVLPCLVTEIVPDAMTTARNGEAAIHETARCALEAFAELKTDEAPGHPEKERFAPLLEKCEKEVRKLLPSPGGVFGLGGSPGAKVVPGKPIKITSAHIVSELICHNVSEFHYPGIFPKGVREE